MLVHAPTVFALSIGLWVLCAGATITLDEVREASRQNLEAQKARFEVQRAQANTRHVRSYIFPQLDVLAGGSVAHTQRSRSFQPITVDGMVLQREEEVPAYTQPAMSLGVTLGQLVYDGGRWWNLIARALSHEEVARAQAAEQGLAAELEAVRRFYEAVKARLTLGVLKGNLERSREQLDRAQVRLAAGQAERREVLDAEVSAANDRISLLRQERAVAQAELSLAQWLGRSQADEVELPQLLDGAPPRLPAVEMLLDKASAERPVLVAAGARLAVSQKSIELAWADFLPRVTANAAVRRASPEPGFFFTRWLDAQNTFSAGVNLSWDIFSGLEHLSNVERAEADLAQQRAVEAQLRVDVENEIRRTWVSLRTELEVLTESRRNLELSLEALRLEAARYQQGGGNALQVRNAQVRLTQAELNVLHSRVDVEVTRAALRRSVGADWEGR